MYITHAYTVVDQLGIYTTVDLPVFKFPITSICIEISREEKFCFSDFYTPFIQQLQGPSYSDTDLETSRIIHPLIGLGTLLTQSLVSMTIWWRYEKSSAFTTRHIAYLIESQQDDHKPVLYKHKQTTAQQKQQQQTWCNVGDGMQQK